MPTESHIRKLLGGTGWIVGLALIAAVLGLQFMLFYSSIFNEASNTLSSLAAVYVAAMLFFGYATKNLKSDIFLAVLFAGWSILMAASSAIHTSVGYAGIAVFTAICTVYYTFQHFYYDN